MSNGRDILDFLEDAVDAMEKAEQFISEMSYEEFKKDDKTIFAVIRALEIIGEAIKHVPDDFRNNYPDVPWRDISGMRDVLIHDYFGIDIETVWETVITNIPKTKPLIEMILKRLTKNNG
jgi:uncharacterized protein with HEPN domain